MTRDEVKCGNRTWTLEIDNGVCTIRDPSGAVAHKSAGHESTAGHLAMLLDERREVNDLGDKIDEAHAARIADLERRLAVLHAALNDMNKVSRHQCNRLIPATRGLTCAVHPFTCGVDSAHGNLFPLYDAGRLKLICPDCDYTQDIPDGYGQTHGERK